MLHKKIVNKSVVLEWEILSSHKIYIKTDRSDVESNHSENKTPVLGNSTPVLGEELKQG